MTHEERYGEAVRRIEDAAGNGSAELSLAGLELTAVPETLGDLTQLRRLDLGSSKLTSLPGCLRKLTNLSELELKNSDLTALPEWIGELTCLTKLELECNRLTSLPESLGGLVSLTCLGLHRSISDPYLPLPDSLSNLVRLEVLDLARCGLSALPGWMSRLTGLTVLNLYGNDLTELPSWLGNLTRLFWLSLGENRLAKLPDSLGNLAGLMALRLNDNQLTELPDSMGNLASLKALWVDRNPLDDLPSGLGRLEHLEDLDFTPGPRWVGPPAAVTKGGTANVLEWLRKRKPQRRAKLVIVGEGKVGKTSLLKALTGQPHDSEEPVTHGLSVRELAVEDPAQADVTMRLSAWDFGGQQIYQGVHQFFLTDHCLVVLVWNARQGYEKGDLGKWLDVIEARAPGATILIVATHCAGWVPDLPSASLLAGYQQIADSFTVDCATRMGIDEFRQALAGHAARLRIMREAWHATWLQAREACRDADREYVSRSELYRLFSRAGVSEPGKQWELAQGLTELGEILGRQPGRTAGRRRGAAAAVAQRAAQQDPRFPRGEGPRRPADQAGPGHRMAGRRGRGA